MKKQGFDRGHRLRSARDFQRVYREAAGLPRLGLVAVRQLGGAVARNRVKRIIREAFRSNQGLFAGWEVIVQLRPAAMALSNEELRAQFLRVGTQLARPG